MLVGWLGEVGCSFTFKPYPAGEKQPLQEGLVGSWRYELTNAEKLRILNATSISTVLLLLAFQLKYVVRTSSLSVMDPGAAASSQLAALAEKLGRFMLKHGFDFFGPQTCPLSAWVFCSAPARGSPSARFAEPRL